MISPDPASDDISITADQKIAPSAQKDFSEIRIYDLQGNVKKIRKFNKVKSATINVSDLGKGNYWIEIKNDNYSEKRQLFIQ